MAIIDKARERGAFKRPDLSGFIPPEMQDAVARISAAGQKMMFAPEMRDQLKQAVESDAPVPQKMAENVAGLMLTLDRQSAKGLPEGAIFPAALDLLGEAADVLTQAGTQVTTEEYNEAARMLFVLLAKKMGASDEEIMGTAAKAAGMTGNEDMAPADAEAAEPPPAAPQDEEMV